MNITHKDWFCYQCSFQFDSQHVYSLHLKLLHKHRFEKKSIANKLESIEPHASAEKSDLDNQIVLDQNEKKIVNGEVFPFSNSKRDHFLICSGFFYLHQTDKNLCFS